MTQVFTNVSSLADFLVAQKNLPKTQTDTQSPVSGFEDFLSSQLTIGDLPVNSLKASDFGNDNKQVDIEDSINSNVPIWELSGFIKLPMPQLAALNEQTIGQTLVDNGMSPSETIIPVQINLGQLKQMASQQNIPLSLTLNPAELASITDINEFTRTAIPIPGLPELEATQNPGLQPSQNMAELPQLTQLQINKVKIKPTAFISTMEKASQPQNEKNIRLTVDASKLIDAQESRITANISQCNSVARETQVKVADLLNLIKEMPEKTIIQIKTIPTYENQTRTQFQIENPQEIPKFEKSYLVDLNSMVKKDDSESIGALQKMTMIKTAPGQATINATALNNTSESTRIATFSDLKVAELSVPIGEFIKSEQPDNRKSDNQPIVKTDSIEPRSPITKLANEEIQPIETNKSTDNSLTNAFSRGLDFNRAGNQIATERKPLSSSEPRNFIIKQQRILNQIQSQLKAVNGNTQLTIQLKPESLGKVKVELKTDGDKLNATFKVDSLDVKRVLDAELPNLKSDWKIDNFKVETNARGANDNFGNSANFNQARMSEGRSSGASYRTNQSDNRRDIQNQKAAKINSAARNGRIDIFA